MTEEQEDLLQKLIPEYREAVDIVKSLSDYEIKLLFNNSCVNLDNIREEVLKEIQWDIIGVLFGQFIENWDEFLYKEEGLIMDYCFQCSFIKYNYLNNYYELSKSTILSVCKELIDEADGNYSINEEVDFRDVIARLNRNFSPKFVEV